MPRKRPRLLGMSLLDLPIDVAMQIAAELTSYADMAAYCLAAPRLGLLAIRTLPAYKDVILSVALRAFYVTSSLVRRYVARMDATKAGCEYLSFCTREGWSNGLNLVRFGKHLCALRIVVRVAKSESGITVWSMRDDRGEHSLRKDIDNMSVFYRGGDGRLNSAQKVRTETSDTRVCFAPAL